MMRRLFPFPVLSFFLVIVWLLLVAEVSVGQVLLAILLAWLIPLACRPFLEGTPPMRHPLAAVRLLFLVTYDIVLANIAVARLILGRPSRLRPVFVQVPLELTRPMSISLLASIVTMTPGTVSADVSEGNTSLLVHVLDCDDPDAIIAEIKQRYEKPLMEIFGC